MTEYNVMDKTQHFCSMSLFYSSPSFIIFLPTLLFFFIQISLAHKMIEHIVMNKTPSHPKSDTKNVGWQQNMTGF